MNQWIVRSIGGLILAASAWAAAPLAAQQAELDPGVEAGREALGAGRFPWYDARRDALQPWQIPQRSQPMQRTGAPALPSSLGDVLEALGWTLLILLVIGAVYLLIRAFWDSERGAARGPDAAAAASADDVTRLEELPFMARRAQSELLSHAQRCYQNGDYREAIVYLFSHQLLMLDRRGLLRLDRGKTNRQYLRELGPQSPLGTLLARTMVGFEGVFFGQHPLDRGGFEQCWSRLDEFDRLLGEGTPA